MTVEPAAVPAAPRGISRERLRGEQIALIYNMVGMTVFPTIAVGSVLAWTLRDNGFGITLYLWLAALSGWKLLQLAMPAPSFGADPSPRQLSREIVKLCFVHGMTAAIWTSLPWFAIDHARPAQVAVIVAVMSGIVGSAVSLLAPVMVVFATYCTVAMALLLVKFATMADADFHGLALVILFFMASMTLQARSSSRASAQAILVGFANLELTDSLAREAQVSQAARDEALAANAAKNKFLAAASHDLRQPIHAMGLFLEVLWRSATLRDRRTLDHAKAAAAASSEMLDLLLDFSRAEAGVMTPLPRAFALQDLFNALENELALQADEKKIVYRTHETGAVVESDPALVKLLLRNLVSNAIRYTDRGGLLVGCRRRGGQIVVEVWDTGVGIAPEQQAEVFREFHQLGNPERDRRKGLGLGLAIASRIAETLGSAVTLRSQVGRGSVFRVALPLAMTEVAHVPLCRADAAPVALAPDRRRHILVLDDDEAIRLGMDGLISGWGYSCDVAETIEEACAHAARRAPDLLVSDFRLRERENGAEAVALLRARIGRPVPALLITGDTHPARLREAAAAGLGILHKPVSPGALLAAIEATIAPVREAAGA